MERLNLPAKSHLHRRRPAGRLLILIGLLVLGVACTEGLPPIEDTFSAAPSTTETAENNNPEATPVTEAADGTGRAFYRAWEGRDYAGMYNLLTPRSQALVDREAFINLYQESMETATVRAIHAQPLAARQEGAEGQMTMRVTWDTALLGTISRDHDLNLRFEEGRWGVVWGEHLILPEMDGGERLNMEYRIPARANIYDFEGQALAYQGTAVTLGVVPGQIVNESALVSVLSPLLNKTAPEIQELYAGAPADWFVPVGEITGEQLQANAETILPFFDAGLSIRERLTRLYPENGIAPHLTGYVGFIPAEELSAYRLEGYRGDEKTGLAGIESWGEPYLRGTRGGVLTIVGANGEYIDTVAETEPRQARSIYTTFSSELQQKVEQALAAAITSHPDGQAGSAIVMEVDTGRILAMASYPSYNPAIFDTTRPDVDSELNAVLSNPGNPLVNRAAQGAYPAGSIFKVVTLAAGLQSGLYEPNSLYYSTGTWDRLGENYIKVDWREGGHGQVTMAQALTVSCNSCFYDMGYNVDEQDNYLFPVVATQMGLGTPTGIQGIAESPGLIPDPDWKLATYGEGWARGDAVNMAIGQGFVQVTPLQMVRLFAAIANGGTLYQPTIIDRIGAGGGAPEEPWPIETSGSLPYSPENLAVVQQALREVTTANYGTATHRFQNFSVPVAGKTGTAEAPAGGLPHAWFAGWAPSEPYTGRDGITINTPEIAVIAMVEHAGEGSAVAAPIFRRIIELYYDITPLTPFPWEAGE
jgi:penicillin-binding protein 2